MKTPDDGDQPKTGLGAPVKRPQAPQQQPTWRAVPGRPDYETDGTSIRRKELPSPYSIFELYGMPRP